MATDLIKDPEFKQWLADLKVRIRQSQMKAAIKVNTELLRLYWDLGYDIVIRQMDSSWGSGFYKNLSKELKTEFPDMQGFSVTNLKYCKYFYLFYSQDKQACERVTDTIRQQPEGESQVDENRGSIIRQQLVDEFIDNPLFLIPWGHQMCIIDKCDSVHEALFYVQKTIKNGWSRAVLINFIEAGLYQSQGKAITNFDRLLPDVHSDLAKETLKDPYNFNFLTLTEGFKERELENELTANITRFLLELGRGFAYVGKQVPIQVGSKELFIDMLFYHLKLRSYIVLEIKVCEFDAAFTGQLGVYVSAVNHQFRNETDNPTLGLLICKTKDNILAQYSLESSSQPIGISEYRLSELLPEDFKSSLPSIEEIEKELNRGDY